MDAPEPARELSVKDVAWLTRVAPNNAKRWFSDPRFPIRADGSDRRSATWEELSEFCARANRESPLPLSLLDLSPADAHALLQSNSDEEGTELARALKRERQLRASLRNAMAARTHRRQEEAMTDLAFKDLIDLAEGAALGSETGEGSP